MQRKRFLSLSGIGFTLLFILAVGTAVFALAHQEKETGETAASTTEKILVSISNNTVSWSDDTLYSINPDGSNKTELFNFHNHPKFTTGEIYAPRIASDGNIYFHSEHAYIYTPARRNVFRIISLDNSLDQITPGPNSGIWGKTGNSTVSGKVIHGNGSACINCPVYLEGMDSVNTATDGTFSFHNVPAGVRWLMAYRSDLSAYGSFTANVVTNLHNTDITIVPNSDNASRMNFEHPVMFENRIYYDFFNTIKWTAADFGTQTPVYTTIGSCTGIPMIDAFDVGQKTGKIVVYDYQEGCGSGDRNHVGLYVMDKDGNGKTELYDTLNRNNWADTLVAEVFWSPDENFIALKARYDYYGGYNFQDSLIIFDTNGNITGSASSSANLTIYGWSPDGKAILYSEDNDKTSVTLSKIAIDANGVPGTTTELMSGEAIRGATWGKLNIPSKVYLPMIIK